VPARDVVVDECAADDSVVAPASFHTVDEPVDYRAKLLWTTDMTSDDPPAAALSTVFVHRPSTGGAPVIAGPDEVSHKVHRP